MTIRVTIAKTGRSDPYGIPFNVGQTYTLSDEYATDLIFQGFGVDIDGALTDAAPIDFLPYAYKPNSPQPNFRSTIPVFATNADGNVTGTIGPDGTFLPPAPGYRAVLFGDSMTANYNEAQTSTTATYNSATGLLTYPSPAHGLLTGMIVQIYCLSEPGLAGSITVPVTRIDANTVSMQLAPGLQISPLITSTLFMCYPHFISSKGWFTWMNILSGNRFNVIRNSAQDGDITGNALLRIKKTLTDLNPQVVFIQMMGINDIGATVPEETIWTNVQKMLAIITQQAICVCLTTTPVAIGHALALQQPMARVWRLRKRLVKYAAENPKIFLYDACAKVADPTSTIGLGTANLFLTDAIHYSPLGAYTIGAGVWSLISAAFPAPATSATSSPADNYPSSAVTLTSQSRLNNIVTGTLVSHGILAGEIMKITGGAESFNDIVPIISRPTANTFTWYSPGADGAIGGTVIVGRNANLLQTPLLLVTTGGVVSGANASGVAAANVKINQSGTWGTGGTIVASVVANPNGFGNNQQIVATPGTVSVSNPTAIIQVAASNTLLPYMKAGRTYQFGCELTVAGVAASTATLIRSRLIFTTDGLFPEFQALAAVDNAAASMPDGTYDLRTSFTQMPAGVTTAVQWQVEVKFNAVSSSPVTLSVGRLSVVELESL